ncbi:MAG TPA: glycosyltransferase family 4 protein [Vicinamibacterales bacterium]|nr:glycosyltransferase family 4 protein [Vicinamibacterales bacterium]
MRIAFIVQRYGVEILGGSEYHCRLIAERMALKHDVDVVTTCARDYIRWENEYPEGTELVNGVTVRRFANAHTRDIDSFNRYSDWIFHHPHTREDEMSWLKQQGPWCPALIEYLGTHHQSYDVLIFFTYLYAPTVLGLDIDPVKSILVPTAHREPAIGLDIYKEMFTKPSAIAFNTEVEKAFLKDTFDIRAKGEETVGCGVDLLSDQDSPLEFCRQHGLDAPFLLYGGRIDAGKGCDELFDFFATYREQEGDAVLALMGAKLMPLPAVPWVRFLGLLSERERLRALEAATIVVVPSPLESLSLLALEGMAVGTPVLCNERADVLVDHCKQSHAGLFYSNRDEFVECANLLLADRGLRERMGRNGKAYVKKNYHWDVIMSKYDHLIAALPKATPSARP